MIQGEDPSLIQPTSFSQSWTSCQTWLWKKMIERNYGYSCYLLPQCQSRPGQQWWWWSCFWWRLKQARLDWCLVCMRLKFFSVEVNVKVDVYACLGVVTLKWTVMLGDNTSFINCQHTTIWHTILQLAPHWMSSSARPHFPQQHLPPLHPPPPCLPTVTWHDQDLFLDHIGWSHDNHNGSALLGNDVIKKMVFVLQFFHVMQSIYLYAFCWWFEFLPNSYFVICPPWHLEAIFSHLIDAPPPS